MYVDHVDAHLNDVAAALAATLAAHASDTSDGFYAVRLQPAPGVCDWMKPHVDVLLRTVDALFEAGAVLRARDAVGPTAYWTTRTLMRRMIRMYTFHIQAIIAWYDDDNDTMADRVRRWDGCLDAAREHARKVEEGIKRLEA